MKNIIISGRRNVNKRCLQNIDRHSVQPRGPGGLHSQQGDDGPQLPQHQAELPGRGGSGASPRRPDLRERQVLVLSPRQSSNPTRRVFRFFKTFIQDLFNLLKKINVDYDYLSGCDDIDVSDIVGTLLDSLPGDLSIAGIKVIPETRSVLIKL